MERSLKMISQYLSLDNNIHFFNYILWIIINLTCYVAALYSFYKYYSNRSEIEKKSKENIITWGFFFLMQGIASTLNVTWRFLIIDAEIAYLINGISIYVVFIGYLIKVMNVEKAMKQANLLDSRYGFTLINLIIIMVLIILNPNFITQEAGPGQITLVVLSIISYSILPAIFIYLGVKSDGDIKRNCYFVSMGLILIFLGTFFQPQSIEHFILNWPNYEMLTLLAFVLTPFGLIIGTLIIIFAYIKNIR